MSTTQASIITKRKPLPERQSLTKPEHYHDYNKSIVVDSRYENLANLIVHIEGSNWKVNYYQQVLADDTQVAGHHPTVSPVNQQYIKIEEFILKVDTSLSWQQNNETKSGRVTGSAHVYPPFIPNQGDMFIADVGDGNPAIFKVILSEKLSIFKQASYRIEYELIDYADGHRLVDLDEKVIDRRFFDMDFLEYGQNPVLLESEKKYVLTIRKYYPILAENYFQRYYSERFRCMVLPIEDKFVYDPFLTKAISRWYSSQDYYKLLEMKVPPIDNIPNLKVESLFDMVEDQNDFSFPILFTKVGMANISQFAISGRLPQLSRMGLEYVVYPLDPGYSVNISDKHRKSIYANTTIFPFDDNQYQGNFGNRESRDIPLIPILNLNNSYIFSKHFYSKDSHLLSHLEIQVLRYLKGDHIVKEVLFELIESYPKWSPIQQFYFTPFLLMLMKASLRGL